MPSSYLLLNNLRFHYLYWNQDGENNPIILHHGLASNARIWQTVAPILAQAGHPVFAYDARGHGLSDKPDDGYDIETITTDLAAFIEGCRLIQPIIVGHSWGASAALRFAARYALGPLAPAGVGLVDGGFVQLNDGRRTWEEIRQRLTPPKLAGLPVDTFKAKLKEWNASWNPSEEALGVYMASFSVDENERITPRLSLDRHMAILHAQWNYPLYEDFARVRCPVLVIAAKNAIEAPEDRPHRLAREAGLERLRGDIPQARIITFADTIHDVPLQRPTELAQAILDWLA